MRGLGNGIAATANWATNAVVSYSFLPAARQLGASTSFGAYAALCALGGVWAARALPETKGATSNGIGALPCSAQPQLSADAEWASTSAAGHIRHEAGGLAAWAADAQHITVC